MPYKLTSQGHDREAKMIATRLYLLTEDDRIEIMGRVHQYFCINCWRELETGEICHCTDDE